MCYINTKG